MSNKCRICGETEGHRDICPLSDTVNSGQVIDDTSLSGREDTRAANLPT